MVFYLIQITRKNILLVDDSRVVLSMVKKVAEILTTSFFLDKKCMWIGLSTRLRSLNLRCSLKTFFYHFDLYQEE